jgi:hypothetical protein
MSKDGAPADVYQLKGLNIELTYRRSDHTLDVNFADESLSTFGRPGLEADERAGEDGLHVTTTLLGSTRTGKGILLTVLLPDVRWGAGVDRSPADVTGVATVTENYEHLVDGPPPALQSYGDPWHLEGTAAPKS